MQITLTPADFAVGIDVSKDKLDVCVLGSTVKGKHNVFPNDPSGHEALLKWCKLESKGKVCHYCMEFTGAYSLGIGGFLHAAGERVSIVNPAVIKYSGPSGSSNKTDKADALKIARFVRSYWPKLWEPVAPAIAELIDLQRHMHDLSVDLQGYETRLKNPGQFPSVQQSLNDTIVLLKKQIAHVQKQIDNHIKQDPHLPEDLKLLESIPGIGKATAAVLLAEIRDIKRFASGQSLAAFFGLSPKLCQSGKSAGRTRISKAGSSFVRAKLYMPSLSAIVHNPQVKALYERLKAAGKHPMGAAIAAMRKLVLLAYGVLSSRRPYERSYVRSPA